MISEFSQNGTIVESETVWLYTAPKRAVFITARKGHLQSKREKIMKKLINILLLVFALAIAGMGVSLAEVPAGVTTALTAASTDGSTIGYAIFGVLVALFGIKVLRRVL